MRRCSASSTISLLVSLAATLFAPSAVAQTSAVPPAARPPGASPAPASSAPSGAAPVVAPATAPSAIGPEDVPPKTAPVAAKAGAAAVEAPPVDSAAPGAATSAAGAPGEGPNDWADRDLQMEETNTLTGGSGLLRTQHAALGAPGQFRLGLVGEWFSAGFLCSDAFKCPNPAGGQPLTSDTLNHSGATLSLGVSIAKVGAGTLEGYAATSVYANSDDANRPSLLQVLGDTDLGLKFSAPVGDVVRLGLFSELWLINGLGTVGLDGGGTSARFGGIGTLDLRGLSGPVPLRFSGNVAYVLDNTADVVSATESAVRGGPVTRIERFGLGINRVDHVDFLLGGEAFVADGHFRPFAELKVLVPSNRQGYRCRQDNGSGDRCLQNDTVFPATLTLGARVLPWKRGFSLLAALDIGVSGTSDFIEELQPVAPWTLFLGAGWATDTWDRPVTVKTVEKPVEVVAPTVRVVGFVHEKGKNDPVTGALVSYRDHPELSPLSTGADGKFGDDVPTGTYTYELRADGYKPGTCEANAVRSAAVEAKATAGSTTDESPAAPKAPAPAAVAAPSAGTPAPAGTPTGTVAPAGTTGEVDIDCPLEALPRTGTVVGHARDAETSQPLVGIQVSLADPAHKDLRAVTDATGGFRFDAVAPGTSQLSIIADGYLAIVAPTDVKARQESVLDLLLRPKPKNPEVTVTAKEITIRNQVQFALDSSVILPQSFGLLTEVADTVIRHNEIKRIEVQGHTDNSGTVDHNKGLSEERAEAVRGWLVQHGVPSDRLVAKGYGQEKPLVPNVTASNRAQNRRVQFIILEKDVAAGAPAAPSPATAPAERKKNPLPGF